jgi:hypothetical protein
VLPSEQENLKYSDWAKMVSGLMDDTPLGRIVGVRSETDPNIIKNFTQEQRAIQADWRRFKFAHVPKVSEEDARRQMDQLEKAFAAMFGRTKTTKAPRR